MLRNQLVRGIKNDPIQQKLLGEAKLTLKPDGTGTRVGNSSTKRPNFEGVHTEIQSGKVGSAQNYQKFILRIIFLYMLYFLIGQSIPRRSTYGPESAQEEGPESASLRGLWMLSFSLTSLIRHWCHSSSRSIHTGINLCTTTTPSTHLMWRKSSYRTSPLIDGKFLPSHWTSTP